MRQVNLLLIYLLMENRTYFRMIIQEYGREEEARNQLMYYKQQKWPYFVMRATFPSTCIACFEKIGKGHFMAVHGKVRPPFPSWEVENCLVMPNRFTEALAYDVDHTPYVRERANWVHASCKFAKIPPCAVCGAEKLPTVKFYKQSGTRNIPICGDCKRAGARA